MYLSNQANRFLTAIVREFRYRCRHGDGSNVLFTFQYLKLKRFQKFSEAEAKMCIWELSENDLIRKYDDGGFSVTPKTIAFYDENTENRIFVYFGLLPVLFSQHFWILS